MTKTKKKQRTFEGLPVVDADDNIVLHVTPTDVRIAKQKDPGHCAAAGAGRRALKTDVRVFLSRMYVKHKKHWTRYVTPGNATREIISFDRGSSFEPGEYVFKAASPGQRLGVQRGDVHASTGKGRRRKMHHTANVRMDARHSYD